MPLTPVFRQATTALVWAQTSSSNQLPDDRNMPFITAEAPRPPGHPRSSCAWPLKPTCHPHPSEPEITATTPARRHKKQELDFRAPEARNWPL